MNLKREIIRGFLAACITSAVVLSGILIGTAESKTIELQVMTPTNSQNSSGTITPINTASLTPTQQPTRTFTSTATFTFTASSSPTHTPTVTACPIPSTWERYVIKKDDTLENLAKKRKITVDEIRKKNCLGDLKIVEGMVIYLPPLPITPTQTPEPVETSCPLPSGWIVYTIQSGDTLFSLAALTGISVSELQQTNCMGTSTELVSGETLYLPIIPILPPPLPTPGQVPTVIPIPISTLSG